MSDNGILKGKAPLDLGSIFKKPTTTLDNNTEQDKAYAAEQRTCKRNFILNAAKRIINGDREGAYGKPENNFGRIAKLWSDYLGVEITPVQVADLMILLKVARNASGVYKQDNWIDICGYAALGAELGGR